MVTCGVCGTARARYACGALGGACGKAICDARACALAIRTSDVVLRLPAAVPARALRANPPRVARKVESYDERDVNPTKRFEPREDDMSAVDFVIRESKIKGAGMGVFAQRGVSKGAVVGRYTGNVSRRLQTGRYVMELEDDNGVPVWVDAESAARDARDAGRPHLGLVNHNFDKTKVNVRVQADGVAYAKMDIAKDGELYIHYGSDAEKIIAAGSGSP